MGRVFGRGAGIGTKFTMLICTLVLLSGAVVGTWTGMRYNQVLVQRDIEELGNISHIQSARFNANVKSLSSDARFLAEVPPIQAIVRATQSGTGVDPASQDSIPVWRDRLNTIFSQMMHAKPHYDQIRYIGLADEGRELVRVDRFGEDGAIRIVEPNQMQAKGRRAYFLEALEIPPGDVYLSKIELNREYGAISEPQNLVLRAAVTIRDEAGQPFGIVIINQDVRLDIATLHEGHSRQRRFFVMNEDERFLFQANVNGPNDIDVTIGEASKGNLSELAATVLGAESESKSMLMHSGDGNYLAVSHEKICFDPANPERFLRLIVVEDYDDVTAATSAIRTHTVLVVAVILAIAVLAGIVFSNYLTKPLQRMSRAVEAFGRGESIGDLPTDVGGEPGMLAHAFTDMIEQVEQRAAELRNAEARHRTILENAIDAIITIDVYGNIESTNPATTELFGYESSEIVGRNITVLMPSPHKEKHDGYLATYRKSGPTGAAIGGSRRVEGQRKDGSVFPLDLSVSEVRMEDGTVLLTGIVRDVTDRSKWEDQIRSTLEELKLKNKEMEQFTYTVSHDLKSPLVSMSCLVGCMKEDLDNGEMDEVYEAMDRIERNVFRMEACINDLLELSRVGRVRHAPEVIETNQLVAEVADQLKPQFEASGCQLEIEPDLPAVTADRVRIGELFLNLMSNALKYGRAEKDSKIYIGSRVEEAELLFFVRDNGPGIPERHQKRIFDLFQRLDGNHEEGTGVGLTIVQRIMEVHGGRVWVESVEGLGAAFWLAFPRVLVCDLDKDEQPQQMVA